MKNKIKIFIALGITLITTLICTISTFAQAGYIINQNGNIESLNLFKYFNWWTNDTTDPRDYFNLAITFNDYQYIAHVEGFHSTGRKRVSFTTPSTLNNISIYHSGSSYNIFILQTDDISFLQPNTTYTFYFDLDENDPSRLNGLVLYEIMLYRGTVDLDYFPYGNYTNNKNIGNNGQIYEQLNGTTAKLFQTNITNINTALNTQGIIEEIININNQTSYTWNSSSIQTIENCIINYNPAINLSNRATVLLQLKNATMFDNLTFTRIDKNEDRYIYLYNENKKLITTLTIARKVENITHII